MTHGMRAALVALVLGFGAAAAQAQVIFSDDFESYPDTTALNATWPLGVGTASINFLDVGPAGSSNTTKTVHSTNRASRRDRNFASALPTASNPLRVQYDLYDAAAETDAGATEYNQLLAFNGASLSQLISMGKSNLVAAPGVSDPTKYQARVAFGSVNWLNLNATRSIGWHTFRADIFDNHVDFYVDNIFDQTVNFTATTLGTGFTQARIGSGLGTRAEEGYYDNYSVELVPEPASMGLIALGGAALLARRRK